MTQISGICSNCNKAFSTRGRHLDRKNSFCSRWCYFDFRKKHPPENNCTCQWCQRLFYKKESAIKNGEGKFCSRECKLKSQRQGIEIRGESYNERHLLRQSSQYKCWRLKAKQLKNFKCEKCGIKEGTTCPCCGVRIQLHVHHVQDFATHLELRFDPLNASVLCPKCHTATQADENNLGWIAGTPRTGNQQPSQEIAKGSWKVRRSGLRKQ